VNGMDALLSTVMMPPGIPVATVGIDAAQNAGLLAAEMLSIGDDALSEKLKAMREENKKKVLQKDAALNEKIASL
ncbi:MAG: AIR carboxylase family protein, partial [Spirochaetales bacterium]|nr:AIR carboxylase family protein [Candidatus Physcosoma equi]